ncbi:hypothetical protein DL93DRAFT_2072986 [Clavulina sp. PMI_390]|nr:hypothetical protein DL93DRAFT_2072986 [Clavulina sp. PMI_390]
MESSMVNQQSPLWLLIQRSWVPQPYDRPTASEMKSRLERIWYDWESALYQRRINQM